MNIEDYIYSFRADALKIVYLGMVSIFGHLRCTYIYKVTYMLFSYVQFWKSKYM